MDRTRDYLGFKNVFVFLIAINLFLRSSALAQVQHESVTKTDWKRK